MNNMLGPIILVVILVAAILLIISTYGFFWLKEVFTKREDEDFLVIAKCPMKTWVIPVEDIELKNREEVAKIRIMGIAMPEMVCGIYYGPYGTVTVMAKTKYGLFIRSKNGKLYFIGAPEAKDIYSQYVGEGGEIGIP